MENTQFKRPGKDLKNFAANIKAKGKIFLNENSFGKNLKTGENVVIKSYPLQPLICNFSEINLQDCSYENSISRILSRLQELDPISPKHSCNKNTEYGEVSDKLQEIASHKEKVLSEANEENEEFEKILREKNEKIEELKGRILCLKGKKQTVQRIFQEEKRVQKFFKDLTRFEIIETFEDLKGFRIRVSSDLIFVEFKLYKENDSTYAYAPLSSNMDVTRIPEVLKSEFTFEKGQMREFYFYVLEFMDLN